MSYVDVYENSLQHFIRYAKLTTIFKKLDGDGKMTKPIILVVNFQGFRLLGFFFAFNLALERNITLKTVV